MKLATYKDGSRDGQLVVVSRDLTTAHYATDIASRLQQALDDWNFIAPQLQDLYEALNQGKARHPFPFDAAQCLAPLPRAYQLLSCHQTGIAPHLVQCTSDALLDARSRLRMADAGEGLNFNAGLAAITGDVPAGATPEQGQDAVRLLTLASMFYLSAHDEESQTSTAALGPVAVTPDELGAAWQGGRVHLSSSVTVSGHQPDLIETGGGPWSFGDIIAVAARVRLRPLAAGTLISIPFGGADGSLCFVASPEHQPEANLKSKREDPKMISVCAGNTVRIEMQGPDGQSVFGAIEQMVE